ncbi:MAG TPA: flavin reductase family protein [Chloroflexia bacterium]|nr:flavin reductase family protein [Chloroflexia bacterium]
MIIDPSQMRPRDAYQLLIGSVVPRPIAWVSTVSPDGQFNLAPFSFFMGISGDPPLMAVTVNKRRRDKQDFKKDTLSNVEALGELVINIANEELAEKMNLTSGEYPAEVDEFDLAGLTPAPSQVIRPPYVAEAPISIECKVNQIVYVGHEGRESGVIIAEGLLWHVRDDLLTPNQTIDVTKLHAIGRLSYNNYTRTNDLFEMIRPDARG